MWETVTQYGQRPSFVEPQTPPAAEPTDGPLVCVSFSQDWLPVVCGALMQLVQPGTWDATGTALQTALARATDLIALFGTAAVCVPAESGLVSITIPAGDGSASAAVTFAGTYAAAPHIVVSCDSLELAATWLSPTSTGFTAVLAAATPVATDTTADVSWVAAA